jgi:hypothetical protein
MASAIHWSSLKIKRECLRINFKRKVMKKKEQEILSLRRENQKRLRLKAF